MSMKYIRDQYGVPAKRGARISFEGRKGTIVAASNYIHVRFDDQQFKRPLRLHPTWHVEYLQDDKNAV